MGHVFPVQRIHILGAAGSGKTTVARLLANLYHLPWYELDVIGYEGGFGRRRTLEERQTELARIIAGATWVTEGIFLWWTQEIFKAADRIVWLDLPWHVALPRIVTRHIKADLAGNNRHAGFAKLAKFIWFCQSYYTDRAVTVPETPNQDWGVNRVSVADFLQPYAAKVIHCRNDNDLHRLLVL